MAAHGLAAVVRAAPRLGQLEKSSNLGEQPGHTGTLAVLLGQTHPGREKSILNNSLRYMQSVLLSQGGQNTFFFPSYFQMQIQ